MADYEFRYRLNTAPGRRLDGSAQVAHDIDAVFREQGEPNDWAAVPGHHETILVPADELSTVLAMPNGAAKVQAYKNLLVVHLGDQAQPFNTGWTPANMEIFVDNNDLSQQAATDANEYITVDLDQTYPVTFGL